MKKGWVIQIINDDKKMDCFIGAFIQSTVFSRIDELIFVYDLNAAHIYYEKMLADRDSIRLANEKISNVIVPVKVKITFDDKE